MGIIQFKFVILQCEISTNSVEGFRASLRRTDLYCVLISMKIGNSHQILVKVSHTKFRQHNYGRCYAVPEKVNLHLIYNFMQTCFSCGLLQLKFWISRQLILKILQCKFLKICPRRKILPPHKTSFPPKEG